VRVQAETARAQEPVQLELDGVVELRQANRAGVSGRPRPLLPSSPSTARVISEDHVWANRQDRATAIRASNRALFHIPLCHFKWCSEFRNLYIRSCIPADECNDVFLWRCRLVCAGGIAQGEDLEAGRRRGHSDLVHRLREESPAVAAEAALTKTPRRTFCLPNRDTASTDTTVRVAIATFLEPMHSVSGASASLNPKTPNPSVS
jgi:hypothetical protein